MYANGCTPTDESYDGTRRKMEVGCYKKKEENRHNIKIRNKAMYQKFGNYFGF